MEHLNVPYPVDKSALASGIFNNKCWRADAADRYARTSREPSSRLPRLRRGARRILLPLQAFFYLRQYLPAHALDAAAHGNAAGSLMASAAEKLGDFIYVDFSLRP